MIEDLIKKIHKGPLYGEFIENGGPCIAAELLKVAGASNTIHHATIPYSKDFNTSGYRSVSLENVAYIERIANNCCANEKVNFRFVSSFQIGPDKVTHGYIALRKFGKLKFYHLTCNEDHLNRKFLIELLNDSQIQILQGYKAWYIDGIWNEDMSPNISETLEEIKNGRPNSDRSVFIKNGQIYRTEDFLRSAKNLVIYKGSFNPIHKGHEKIIKYFEKQKDTSVCFSISTNTYDKETNIKNLVKRIEWINKLGYGVLIYNNPSFAEMIDFVRSKISEKQTVTFPLGSDTYSRLRRMSTFEDIASMKAKFVVFDRGVRECGDDSSNVEFVKCDINMSSSDIRNGNFENVPNNIREEVKEYFKNSISY